MFANTLRAIIDVPFYYYPFTKDKFIYWLSQVLERKFSTTMLGTNTRNSETAFESTLREFV